MDEEITVNSFAKYRLNRAKQDLSDAEFSYKNNRFLTANNRAYYSIFHAIRAVLTFFYIFYIISFYNFSILLILI